MEPACSATDSAVTASLGAAAAALANALAARSPPPLGLRPWASALASPPSLTTAASTSLGIPLPKHLRKSLPSVKQSASSEGDPDRH